MIPGAARASEVTENVASLNARIGKKMTGSTISPTANPELLPKTFANSIGPDVVTADEFGDWRDATKSSIVSLGTKSPSLPCSAMSNTPSTASFSPPKVSAPAIVS